MSRTEGRQLVRFALREECTARYQRNVRSLGTRLQIPDMTSHLAKPIAFAAMLLAVIACVASLSQVSAQCTHDHSGDHAGHSHDHGHDQEISGGGGKGKGVSSICSQAVVAVYQSADSKVCIPNKYLRIDSCCIHTAMATAYIRHLDSHPRTPPPDLTPIF